MKPIKSPIIPQSKGEQVANLQECLLFLIRKGIFNTLDLTRMPNFGSILELSKLLKEEIKESFYGKATTELVRIFQVQYNLRDNVRGIVEAATADKLNKILTELKAFVDEPINDNEDDKDIPADDNSYTVRGTITNDRGAPLSGCVAEVFILTIENALSAGKTISGKSGEYVIEYRVDEKNKSPDIEVRVFQESGRKQIAKSAIKYNASKEEVLDIIVAVEEITKETEFGLLSNEIKPHLGKLRLTELKEDDKNHHISFLSNKTGWDARLTAMLASSAKLSEKLKIDSSHVYALLRSGVPGNEEAIIAVSSGDAQSILKNAVDKNIISSAGNIQETINTLDRLSLNHILNYKPASAISSMSDMLDLRAMNSNQKNIVARVQKQVGDDSEKLWTTLSQQGFDANMIDLLKLDGKMGYLTAQNVPLIKRVYEKFNVKKDIDLVSSGLYKSNEWMSLIGNDLPKGVKPDEYARHLAFQVKISYPTAVAGEMIRRKEINLGNNAPVEELHKFFSSNQTKNHIGTQPVKNWDGFDQLTTRAKASAKTMERIYQMSPSDESMIVLANSDLTSAYQILNYTKTEFLNIYGDTFPNITEAEMTYNKAVEINNASIGIATGYITARNMPNVYSITGSLQKVQNETIAYPTLEDLLGNMDYCACEHCRSVLSPAAYLVELLHFIDMEKIPHKKENPIDVLLKRRPDIQHIQLSCENTNMALPYIDLVNEILEHYILHGNLTDLIGHDISEETTQSELLAEPQFVEKKVYEELKTKVFPYNLPFHQPLETLRRIFNIWDTNLEEMLSVFSIPLSSRKEALGFSEDEYKTISDIKFKKLPEYFGKPAGNTIDQLNIAIANGKAFCRTVGIQYEDLVTLLKTNFINPGLKVIPLFQKLQIGLGDLYKFYNGTLSDAALEALIPSKISPDDYEGDIKQWLTKNKDLIMEMITLTDIEPESVECDFAKVELRYALPDNAINQLKDLSFHKFHRFIRLLRKTGWSIRILDSVISTLIPIQSENINLSNIDSVFVILLNRIANFKKIADLLSYSEKKFPELFLILNNTNNKELRIKQCAKITKLSLPDLSELCTITGIDPLADDMETDEPSLLKFIYVSRKLKANSLKVSDLAYILNHVDLSGKLTVDEEIQLKNVKLLRDTLNGVEKENNIVPGNADFNFARSKMSLVYDTNITDYFFGLILGTNVYSEPFATSEEVLPKKITDADGRIGFDPFKKELTYRGVLSESTHTLLKNIADGLKLEDMEVIETQSGLDTFILDFKTAAANLLVNSNAGLTSFAAEYPELKIIYDQVITDSTPESQTKRLIDAILPELKSKLKINAIRQTLIGLLKTDAETVNVLTSSKDIIHSASDLSKSVLHDFFLMEEIPLFNQNKAYSFYIDIPATDEYLFYITAVKDTVISLTIDENPIISNITVGDSKEIKNLSSVSLKTGALHKVTITISSLPANETVNLFWRTKGMAKSAIPVMAIYANENVDFAKESLIRLSKASQLQKLLEITPAELNYFASANEETKNFLNELDTDGSISNTDLEALWGKINLLIDFKEIKEENEPEDNTWLQVLQNPHIKNKQDKFILEYFNLWKEADLTAVLQHFGLGRSDLSKLSHLKKVVDAMSLLGDIYYPASDVLTWITNDPTYDLVAGIKSTIKQKVTESVWLETMQTVSDPVRNLLRDALVNYILHYKKPSPEIVTPDKLYEYFLIDVEMDACMKTSRIRMALSTLQLFIQRCMMNLEPDVSPDSIRAEQWVWMKRYRLWEANRKVFLYPENWLEPELRDNKSSLFKELEGELLQAEVTDESAELAFLNYLKKLDDIAKLEVVGMYLDENEKGNQFDDVLHVIGRTNGNTRQYYYRRYEYGYWTPWEKINLNIEGDHIFPIVWRRRLFLYWLNIFEKPLEQNSGVSPKAISDMAWTNQKKINVEINMCWGEYYKGKWTSPKSTELKRPVLFNNLSSFDSSKLLVYGRKDVVENPVGKYRERLVFFLGYISNDGGTNPNTVKTYQRRAIVTFTSKNAPPVIEYVNEQILGVLDNNSEFAYLSHYSVSDSKNSLFYNRYMMPDKVFNVNVMQPQQNDGAKIKETVFTKGNKLKNEFSITPLRHPVENQFEAPFTYSDENSSFFVQPDEKILKRLYEIDFYIPRVELPPLEVYIPELIEKPIPGWPPIEVDKIKPDKVITPSDPWNQIVEQVNFNVNYNKILDTTTPFQFDGKMFDTSGVLNKSITK